MNILISRAAKTLFYFTKKNVKINIYYMINDTRGVIILKTGFIGVGNMGGAILRGFAASDTINNKEIYIFSRNIAGTAATAEELGVHMCSSAVELAQMCDIIILGVKPDAIASVTEQIADVYTDNKIVISMAAGISIKFLQNMLGGSAKIVRIMPNTPALVGEAMTAVFVNNNITEEETHIICDMFSSVGRVEIADEELIHCIIGVSGSSPAYTYMYIDALAGAAAAKGMNLRQARIFAAQSVLGAAKMVLETGQTPEQLRINVCSPGGTTIEAVKTLQQNGFEDKLIEGFNSCVKKSEEMSR